MKYYVDSTAVRNGDGSRKHPFQTIQAAADVDHTGGSRCGCTRR